VLARRGWSITAADRPAAGARSPSAVYDEVRGREATENVRSLIDEIEPVPADDERRIDLKGEIAAVPALGAGADKPAEIGRLVARLTLVAGPEITETCASRSRS